MNLNPQTAVVVETHQEEGGKKGRSYLADFLVLAALGAFLFGSLEVSRQWRQPYHNTVQIDLSLWSLPYYTLLSFSRGVIAYGFSLFFTILYARWAAYDSRSEKVLIPILDILQSIPFLAFLTPLVLLLVNIIPHSIIGLELTCVLIIFTGQVWNMTFSFYYSLKNLPADFVFVSKLARFSSLQKFTQVELPFATNGLVYNSMVSMAGGWFFLTVNESFSVGNQSFVLPGIGSYMAKAQDVHNGPAQFYAIVAMVLMIVAVDQLIWRPLIIWSTKFKMEDTEAEFRETSPILRWLSRSRVAGWIHDALEKMLRRPVATAPVRTTAPPGTWRTLAQESGHLLGWAAKPLAITALLCLGLVGLFHLGLLLWQVRVQEWTTIFCDLSLTLLRVLAALFLSTIWTVPVGVWIGSNPKLARYLMPITQIAASFPSPMVFLYLIYGILAIGGNMQWGAVLLMMLGTQWYILFNVISGASTIPQDLRSCADLTHLTSWQTWRTLWLPGIFPALVTGWITAAGGAWNTSLVAEYYSTPSGDQTFQATGLGALIYQANNSGNDSLLAAAVLVMACFVVLFNRTVWKRLALLARERYQLLN